MSFTWNGATSDEMGLNVTDRVVYTGPAYAVEAVSVPGRSGDVLIPDNRFKNKKVTYTGYMRSRGFVGNTPYERLSTGLMLLRGWLLANPGQYLDLEDTYDPGFTRKAYIDGEIGIKEVQSGAFGATVSITFNVQPYMYEKDVEDITLKASLYGGPAHMTITNPYNFDSDPRINIALNGNATIEIEHYVSARDTTWTITHTGTISVTYDGHDWYTGTGRMLTSAVTPAGEFPVFGPGENHVAVGGNAALVTISPRWRTV